VLLQTRTSEVAADKEADANDWGSILMGGGTGRRQGYGEAFAKSLMRSVATRLGNAIVKKVLGGRR
jgi:hypothetical protein